MGVSVPQTRRGRFLPDALIVIAVVVWSLIASGRPKRTGGEGDDEDAQLRRERGQAIRAYGLGLAVSILVTLGVILAAINDQSSLVPDSNGFSRSFSSLFGPASRTELSRGWAALSDGTFMEKDRFTGLLLAHIGADLGFMAVYALLLGLLTWRICREWPWRILGFSLLTVLLVADVLEDLLAKGLFAEPTVLPRLVSATLTKWWALAFLVAVLVLRVVVPRPPTDRLPGDDTGQGSVGVRHRLRDAVRAVVHQRFSYAPVVALFVLSVLSGPPILEQLPDAERSWVFDGDTGMCQAVAAMICTLLLGGLLLVIGRTRTRYAVRHLDSAAPLVPPADSGRHLLVWLVGPALAFVGIVIYVLSGHRELILPRVIVWIGVPVVIFCASRRISRVWRRHPTWYQPDRPLSFTASQVVAVGIAGTIAAVGVVVVGGLSLVRAFTPLVVLPPDTYILTAGATTPAGVVWLLVVAGIAIVGPWLLAIGLTWRHRGPRKSSADPHSSRRGGVLLAFATVAFLVLGVSPDLASRIGLAATATWALGSLACMLSGVGLVLQDRPTAEIFRLLRFRRTPLVTLLVLTVVLVGVTAGGRGLHAVNPGSSVAPAVMVRQPVDMAFGDWLRGAGRCQLSVAGRPVRPMLMIAAEGGGIRAAYWTVRSLQAIADKTCAEYSTLFSAGASGGSVGLTVARLSGSPDDPGSQAAVDAVKQMAKPGPLTQAADGTFVRDIVYGATGVPVPRIGGNDPWGWQDRATLLEKGWVDSGAWGKRTFLGDPTTMSPATGALVLNSTSVKDNCRVWLSQLDLPPLAQPLVPSAEPEQSCDTVPGVAARTTDLFGAYGPLAPGGDSSCLGYISAPTAALLTARFPYVTPSGVVGPCPAPAKGSAPNDAYWPRTQLVDGGYIENTGLATITDLADVWLPEVRRQNQKALADKTRTEPLVVPIVVYLANGENLVKQAPVGGGAVSELAVPPRTYFAAKTALTQTDALLARARDAVELSGFCPGDESDPVCSALRTAFPSRVVVVDRATEPEVSAPLGWVMSEASLDSLEHAISAQVLTRCADNRSGSVGTPTTPPQDPPEHLATCRPGYAALGDLQQYFAGAHATT